jgi:hypothetical protein
MSMNPGATTSPRASMVRVAGAFDAADGDDPVAADGDVRVDPRVACAVHDARPLRITRS